MILVDTPIWIDHLREENINLKRYLNLGLVSIHPFIIGEIALGNLCDRKLILRLLLQLPQVKTAKDWEVYLIIEKHQLWGTGIGYVDAHLLASLLLTPNTQFWTRDRKLQQAVGKCDSIQSGPIVY